MVSETHEEGGKGWRRKLKRAWRLRLAKLWHYAYRIRYQAGQYHARYGTVIGGATIVILMAGTAYLLPAVQRGPETRFATEEASCSSS